MSIGENIKNIRMQKGLTQKQLAEKSGVAEITIRQYESDKREPKITQLQKIIVALDLESIRDVVDYPMGSTKYNKIFDSYGVYLSPKERDLLNNFKELNDIGKSKALEQLELLTKIPEYQRTE